MKKFILFTLSILMLISCNKEPEIDSSMLDSGLYFDQSIYQPEKYLVSASVPAPTPAQAVSPVIIAIHGYGATTFEWDEFRTWKGSRTDFSISQVLLGGHGRDYQSFKNSTWRDWREPIVTEFEKLEKAGYTNISFAGSSTGSTLILKLLAEGYFDSHIKPRHVFLIDPIIIPANKTLTLVGVLGPIIGYTKVDNTAGEEKYYYHYRPYETLQQLRDIINEVRIDLQKGVTLPVGTTLKVYKSDNDDVADAASAVLIHKGIVSSTGNAPEIAMIPSKLHVFTRLNHRENTPASSDIANQTKAFSEMAYVLIK
ncbi:carboxylesterase [Daejeonella rubra]|uniref:Carboxylesterase n=1 Tax=Daejeonella rubra TaxID=990371 RepID=A0A1G9NEP1_9SPHI|nr:esterase [Daejeonella rubra]SDL85006.1 carboxylesterase [Daejeonella rubra]